MARKRPISSDVTEPTLTCLQGGRPNYDGPLLTRAEAHALRRSAPLTHSRLEQRLKEAPVPPLRPV